MILAQELESLEEENRKIEERERERLELAETLKLLEEEEKSLEDKQKHIIQ